MRSVVLDPPLERELILMAINGNKVTKMIVIADCTKIETVT